MSYCPSQDWDRYCDDQEKSMASEAKFLQANLDRITAITCAIMSNPHIIPCNVKEEEVVAKATKIAGLIYGKCVEQWEDM